MKKDLAQLSNDAAGTLVVTHYFIKALIHTRQEMKSAGQIRVGKLAPTIVHTDISVTN